MEHDENPSRRRDAHGRCHQLVEAVVAAVLLVIGLVVIFESRRLGAGWTSDGPGVGLLPLLHRPDHHDLRRSASCTRRCSARTGTPRSSSTPSSSSACCRCCCRPRCTCCAISFLGLYVASAIYIALFMIVLGKYSWVKSVIAALAVNTLFFFMFEVWFKVPLFKGSLDPLRFLGY